MDYPQLTIYIPREGAVSNDFNIKRGSAIVGRPWPDPDGILPEPWVDLYYEGDVYGALSGNFDSMLLHAASRLVERYPTVAHQQLPSRWVVPVGTYDLNEHRTDITDEAALARWRGQ